MWFRFFKYVLVHGSFFLESINFEKNRTETLKDLSFYVEPKPNPYAKMRNWLASTRFIGSIIENVAYLKNHGTIHKNFHFDRSHKIGYLRILKSGSTSMLKVMLPLIDEKLVGFNLTDSQVDQLADLHKEQYGIACRNKYQLFTLVRNPFQRLVSIYLDIFIRGKKEFVYKRYLFGILNEDMSFLEFVKVLSIIPPKLLSPHFASQTQIISSSGVGQEIKIFRLDKDKDRLIDFLGHYKLPLLHQNRNEDYDFMSYYDTVSVSLAAIIYWQDIEELNYQEEYEELCNYVKESKRKA